MIIDKPETGICYHEFTVTLLVNGHRKKGKERLLSTLVDIARQLDAPSLHERCRWAYKIVFRARCTHIHYKVLTQQLSFCDEATQMEEVIKYGKKMAMSQAHSNPRHGR